LTATERTLCCILENYQTEEGVKVPTVLQPYMGGKTFLPFVKEFLPGYKEEKEKLEKEKKKEHKDKEHKEPKEPKEHKEPKEKKDKKKGGKTDEPKTEEVANPEVKSTENIHDGNH